MKTIDIKLADLLRVAKKLEDAGAEYSKLVVVVPETNPKVQFYIVQGE